ncbi:ABC transporter ATP-binding protein [Phocicoccus pinnipedialis]|uniref:Putative multidrug resistance ABC transporter ATP-binding/permease protein YheI n=1 Tax=Phocicoccus pinnipedialis TaxID=110845 RepID=A0A6V7REX1_9BACL|nr:ABC transporter transmembrane domain-containing protein [Jeotgalicoccus pinnipedialis]MBP1939179.1 ATP-binding cassette subfamily B protein [Jeotgalicoccus pinnipedialis]CAD2076423.1 putative multidrug resistance ABC transporter ATP-binding/permease protein YheI [Jeotgalicoccus pinnipedialis]
MRVYKNLAWFFKAYYKHYILGVIMLLLVALLQLVPPQVIGRTIDFINTDTLTVNILIGLVVLLIAVALLMYLFRYLWRLLIFATANRLGLELRSQLFKKYVSMSPSFYQKHRTGDLMAHATNDINAVNMVAGAGILTIADSIISGGAVLITMAVTVDAKLTLIAMIPLPFMVILTSYYGLMLHKLFRVAQAAFSSLNDKTQESIAGIKVTKTFGYEKEDLEDFTDLSAEVVRKNLSVAKIDALFNPTITAIIGISYFLSIFFGAKMVISDEITIGQLVTFTTYLGMMVWPLLALGMFFNILQRGNASYDRIIKILNSKDSIKVTHEISSVPEGDIEFKIDTFRFDDSDTVTLRDVHFTVSPGDTVGIVGQTGSGKSTLIRLLLREYDPNKLEEVTYGGQPLSHFDVQTIRKKFGLVPQENFLFSTTIRDNIAFTNPGAPMEEIIEAAKNSYIHHDIERFQYGYDTVVGQRGVSLSGGQKQRISIARALIMDPDVLILDDSLSAVDAETEKAILNNLEKLRSGKTNIITAHRMSAVMDADKIIVMSNGTVLEMGTHDELMENKCWYYDTYKTQSLIQSLEHDLEVITDEEASDHD